MALPNSAPSKDLCSLCIHFSELSQSWEMQLQQRLDRPTPSKRRSTEARCGVPPLVPNRTMDRLYLVITTQCAKFIMVGIPLQQTRHANNWTLGGTQAFQMKD
ncbi:hypothetical protein Salat_1877000 [Sesamum alatum]|uniref:Uncharacterized protein n=1 Tax=Sesamum alatum TaxID=300844 RepID=A0AAE2CI76_9LAMI|nr:hypothetical protein Salat_1877000 [Sesamum alatum]